VQPGLGWQDLNKQLKEKGIKMFFPVRSILSVLLTAAHRDLEA
jgi:hypothetical protein